MKFNPINNISQVRLVLVSCDLPARWRSRKASILVIVAGVESVANRETEKYGD